MSESPNAPRSEQLLPAVVRPRLAEIKSENIAGDVSAKDIDWLLSVADAALWLVGDPFGQLDQRNFYKLRERLRDA